MAVRGGLLQNPCDCDIAGEGRDDEEPESGSGAGHIEICRCEPTVFIRCRYIGEDDKGGLQPFEPFDGVGQDARAVMAAAAFVPRGGFLCVFGSVGIVQLRAEWEAAPLVACPPWGKYHDIAVADVVLRVVFQFLDGSADFVCPFFRRIGGRSQPERCSAVQRGGHGEQRGQYAMTEGSDAPGVAQIPGEPYARGQIRKLVAAVIDVLPGVGKEVELPSRRQYTADDIPPDGLEILCFVHKDVVMPGQGGFTGSHPFPACIIQIGCLFIV